FPHVVSSTCFFFSRSGAHRDLHSFPTRRSSDLIGPEAGTFGGTVVAQGTYSDVLSSNSLTSQYLNETMKIEVPKKRRTSKYYIRSEEHTSELQSRENLVCRLLLEKKKNKK